MHRFLRAKFSKLIIAQIKPLHIPYMQACRLDLFRKKNHEKLKCKAKLTTYCQATTYFFAETSITRFSFHSIVIQIFVRFLNCMKQFLIIDFMQKSMVHGIQPGIKFQKGIKMSNGDIKT